MLRPFLAHGASAKFFFLALGISFASMTIPARAGDEDEFALSYRAPGGCPDEGQFLQEVTRRATRARRVADVGGRKLEVEIAESQKGFSGRFEMREAGSPTQPRTVDGPTCAEVSLALALIAALTLDPNAPPGPPPGSGPLPPPEPPPLQNPVPTSSLAQNPAPIPKPSSASDTSTDGWHFGIGVRVGATSAVAPWPLPTGGILVSASRDASALSTRMSLTYLPAVSGTVPLGRARFSLVALRLAECGAVRLASALDAQTCATFEVGRHEGQGLEGPEIRSAMQGAVAWYAPGLLEGLQLGLGERWFVDTEARAFFPLLRESFVFRFTSQGDVLAHRAPVVGGALEIGGGCRFW